jgi:hypothetical protein
MDDRDQTDSPQTGTPLSRRDLMKRSLALGGLPYVAPMILGSTASLSAQLVSGSGCTEFVDSCTEEPPETLCGEDCFCVETLDGPACVQAECGETACAGAGDCPDDFFCIDISDFDGDCECSFEQFCIPRCGLLQSNDLTAATQSARPRFGRGSN